MSKRKPNRFRRTARDFYPTTYAQAAPLLPHLAPGTRFYEPCAGAGDLVRHLTANGHVCAGATDVAPRDQAIGTLDALILVRSDLNGADLIITNPPHHHDMLVPLIVHFRSLAPAWLLLPLDRLAVGYMQQQLRFASKIVPAKRLRLAGTRFQGHDNYVWIRFDRTLKGTTFLPAI